MVGKYEECREFWEETSCGPVKVPSDQSVELLVKTPFNKSLGK